MVAHFFSGHAHGWELAGWWVCIAAPLTAAAWARWWPSRRRRLARTAADTARVLREIADDALLDDPDLPEDGSSRGKTSPAAETRMARDVRPGATPDAVPVPDTAVPRRAASHPPTRCTDTRPLP